MQYPAGPDNGNFNSNIMFSEHTAAANRSYSLGGGETAERRPDSPMHPPVVRRPEGLIDPGWTRPPQILLVEDDPTCRRIAWKFLEVFYCRVTAAVGFPKLDVVLGPAFY
jgi:hypothetical protein